MYHKHFIRSFLLLLVCISVITSSCKNKDTATVPDIPTIGTAAAGNTQATVSFTAPINNGGSAITGYTVTSSPGGLMGTGSASPVTVTGLTNGTAYTFTVTATNAHGTSLASSASNSITPFATVTDFDGNVYSTVTIGTQVWMKENLRTTTYSNGTPITLVSDKLSWAALGTSSKAYCWYTGNFYYKNIYGALYTWTAAMNGAASSNAIPSGIQGVCPTGWHLPSNNEWTTLTTYLGGTNIAGGQLKEIGFTHWESPNTGATNETGFTALPTGMQTSIGICASYGLVGYWWSSTDVNGACALYRTMSNTNGAVFNDSFFVKHCGFSVRCLKD